MTLFFSDPKSDPYSNHILPSSVLEHLVQPHDLSPGLPQEPNNWSPGSCPILNSLFSAWQPQRIFQNARQIIFTAPCSKSLVSYLRVKVKVLLMACKGPYMIWKDQVAPANFLSFTQSTPVTLVSSIFLQYTIRTPLQYP